jgi:hypothetical protein
MRRTAGVSIPGRDAALDELLGTPTAQVQILAFDQTVTDDVRTLDPLRWWSDPAADWTISSGALRVQAIAGDFTLRDNWKRNLMSIGGDGRGAQLLSKLTPTTIPDGAGAGASFCDNVNRNAVALVLSRSGTHYFVNAVTYAAGAPSRESVVGRPRRRSRRRTSGCTSFQSGAIGFGGSLDDGAVHAGYSLTGPTSGFVVLGAAFMALSRNAVGGARVPRQRRDRGCERLPLRRHEDPRAERRSVRLHGYAYRDPGVARHRSIASARTTCCARSSRRTRGPR